MFWVRPNKPLKLIQNGSKHQLKGIDLYEGYESLNIKNQGKIQRIIETSSIFTPSGVWMFSMPYWAIAFGMAWRGAPCQRC